MLSESLKRCGVCWKVWPADRFTIEDGSERCPNCVDITTASYRAAEMEIDAIRGSQPLTFPISQFPLDPVTTPTVTSITSGGVTITQSAPLAVVRNVIFTVLLNGLAFTSSDVISYTSGITNSSAISRTATVTTLTLIAASDATPSDHYGVTFNDTHFLDIFRVR